MAEDTGAGAAHLVLSGGGVHCLAYVGALRVLTERGIEFASVSTCSAGTFIGALLCAGLSPQRIEREIEKMSPLALLGKESTSWKSSPTADLSWPFPKFSKPGFPDVFKQIMGGRDPTFAELKPPFATAAIDVVSNRLLVYASETHSAMHVSKALSIAVAIPIAYPPLRRKGRILVDAGIAFECPVWLATGRGDALPIVAMRPLHPKVTTLPETPVEYLYESMISAVRSRDDDVIKRTSRVRMLEIDCGDIRSDQFDLTTAQKKFLVTAGRDAAKDVLDQFGDDLGNVRPKPLPSPAGDKPGHDYDGIHRADQLMTHHLQAVSGLVRNQVFFSYCHKDPKDKEWLDLLEDALKPYLRSTSSVVWDDRCIRPGEDWATAIDQALAASKVAVLLVTRNYLASDFIVKTEFPNILDRSRKELKIHWLPVSACGWKETELKSLNASINPAQPLDKLSSAELNEALVAIGEKLKADL